MAKQVQFYSVTAASYAALTSKDAGGIYFVDGGELYKGTSRFGANKVTAQATPPTAEQGAIAGDVNIYNNVTKVFDGSEWQTVVDIGNLGLSNKASVGEVATIPHHGVSTAVSLYSYSAPVVEMTVDAVTSATGITSTSDYFTTGSAIYDYANGLVAGASTTDYVAAITRDSTTGKLTAQTKTFPTLNLSSHTESGNDGGIYVSVTTQSGAVTSVEVSADNLNVSSITAESGTFTNLNVTDTATFSATTVSATSLTVNGSTVEQIADSRISAIPSSTVTSTATGITVGVTTSGGSVTAVSVNAESFTNAMHFLGVGTVAKNTSGTGDSATVIPPAGKTPVAGDIVIDSSTGLEAICTSVTDDEPPVYHWELIGDNALYALNAYTSTASVYTGVNTVAGALNAVGAKADTFQAALDAKVTYSDNISDTSKGENLVTAQAVVNYVSNEINALSLGTAAQKGVANTLTSTGTSLPTESAVASYVSDEIAKLDASPADAGTQGVSVAVVETDGKITSVTTTVTKATLNTTLGTTNVADKTVATSIGATGVDTALATEKAVRDAISDAALVWKNANGQVIA